MRAGEATLRSSRRLAAVERFTRLGIRIARRFGASKWTDARELPSPPRESFRSWWRRIQGDPR